MYFICYQDYDDAMMYSSDTIEGINEFMEKNYIEPEHVNLIEGNLISGIDNKHWPTKFKYPKRMKMRKSW